MSAIDVENAKQIRDPMDVLIKMEVPEEVNLTYSGYASSSKVADAVLDERGWPMRMLADLQGNGFQLDGACRLYDPTVTPSATNGKLGVRGNIGQRLSITVTGDTIINGLSIVASGTDAVHFNGQTAALSGGQVIIPVGASSITIEFDPLTSDTRAEVSTAMAGTSIQVTNDSLISCVVSLRSDLSIDNPTLPESEINIDVYNDVDISEVVASIPDDTPITYSAGYVGDMSQNRQFYISGQITWADNVISIHAVDAVHFLDVEINPIALGDYMFTKTNVRGPSHFIGAIKWLINSCGVEPVQVGLLYEGIAPIVRKNGYDLYFNRTNLRELIAHIVNVFKIDDVPSSAYAYDYGGSVPYSFWINYVDAGRPKFSDIKPSPMWDIYEDDCGSISKVVEAKISMINLECLLLGNYNTNAAKIGSVSWQKGGPAFPSIDELTFHINGCKVEEVNYYILPFDSTGHTTVWTQRMLPTINVINDNNETIQTRPITYQMVDSKSLQIYYSQDPYDVASDPRGVIYTQVMPKDNPQAWKDLIKKGVINDSDDVVNLDIIGAYHETFTEKLVFGDTSGKVLEIDNDDIAGKLYFSNATHTENGVAYPDMAMDSLLKRSNITGSFKWKGDPRMQPRDVVNFHRLDGTVEEITLENITIHHEGGGTYAEITYRKGIC